MRFDATEHLDAWKRDRSYPAIHRPLAAFVSARAKGTRMLDLCCNHGLLGEQLRVPPRVVVGVEGDERAIARGVAAGIGMPMHHLRVDPSSYDELEAYIRECELTVLVARRCLPEILGPVMWSAPAFVAALHAGGIREIFLQGRVPTPKAVSPLSTIAAEVALFAPRYIERERIGQLAYLEVA